LFESFAAYARSHRDDIVKFGRFPYRNQVLGRKNTAAEIEYLKVKTGPELATTKNK
jgi:uncharacterized protein (DUF924 family)